MAFGGFLQANTAVDVIVGPFVDEDNGKTAETGLTITQAEVRLSKNGANIAQKNEATSLTHDELGNYVCKLDTTDTNTEGILTIMIHESGALPIKMDYMVLAQATYISFFTAKDTGFMDIDVKAISTDTTAADNLEAVLDGSGIAADVDLQARSLTLTHDAGVGLAVTGTTDAITATGTAGSGIKAISSGSNGHGLELAGNGSGEGLSATGGTTGEGIEAIGGASGGAGIRAAAQANNDAGMELVKHGTGKDLDADDLADVTTTRMGALTDWINGGRLDLLLDAIKVVTDNMSAAATTMITGTVSYDNTNATTTVIFSDDITEATADHYNGRLFVPTSGALLGQYTDITDYALDTGEGKFTVTALTEAPADNSTFVIL